MSILEVAEPRIRTPAGELAREILIHGPRSRGDLAVRLGLSLATLTRLVRPMLDRGLLMENAVSTGGAIGRPARLLDVRADAGQFMGVKLTGESAFAIATNLRAAERRSARRKLPSHDPVDVVNVIVELANELAEEQGFSAIGISVGGRVSHQRVVDRAQFLGWRSVSLADEVEGRLGVPVIVENDVVALTAAEHWFGFARGLSHFAVITVGSGVGYGLVVHDRTVSVPDTGLGLGGHFPLDPSGPLCPLGHRGCSTAMLTIPSICAQVQVAVGYPVSYDEVLMRAKAQDPVALAVSRAAGRSLGHLISAVAKLAMVEHVVLAGEGRGFLDVAGPDMVEAIEGDRDRDSTSIGLRIDSSGFMPWAQGAAAIAIQRVLPALAHGERYPERY